MKDKPNEPTAKYGYATVIDKHTMAQTKIPIADYVRAEFADHRLVGVLMLEDGTYVLSVENPESSGRATSQTMRLGQESLIALLTSCIMYFDMKGLDMDAMLKQVVEHDKVDYSFSDNLNPMQHPPVIAP